MIDQLRARRSIRKYKNTPIEQDQIKLLQEALLRSPSSRSLNPWHFIFIYDKELLTKLSIAKAHGAAFLENAPLGIVICGDESASDVWIEDCSISAILVQLTAQSLGLGSCWIQIRNRKDASGRSAENIVKEVCDLPNNLRVECIISIGYPDESKSGIPEEELLFERISSRK